MTEWIKASDRLPPLKKEVLAVDEYGDIDFGHYFTGYQGKLCFSSNREIAMPVYWADMPEPPKYSAEEGQPY
jgi:hypothetical protein